MKFTSLLLIVSLAFGQQQQLLISQKISAGGGSISFDNRTTGNCGGSTCASDALTWTHTFTTASRIVVGIRICADVTCQTVTPVTGDVVSVVGTAGETYSAVTGGFCQFTGSSTANIEGYKFYATTGNVTGTSTSITVQYNTSKSWYGVGNAYSVLNSTGVDTNAVACTGQTAADPVLTTIGNLSNTNELILTQTENYNSGNAFNNPTPTGYTNIFGSGTSSQAAYNVTGTSGSPLSVTWNTFGSNVDNIGGVIGMKP